MQTWMYCPACWHACQASWLDPAGYRGLLYAVFECEPAGNRKADEEKI